MYWPMMSMDVREPVQCCKVCQFYKPETRKPWKIQQTVVHWAWEIMWIDLMGPFPQNSHGNLYPIVFVDYTRKGSCLNILKQIWERRLTRMWKQWLPPMCRRNIRTGTNTCILFFFELSSAQVNRSHICRAQPQSPVERALGCWAKSTSL